MDIEKRRENIGQDHGNARKPNKLKVTPFSE